MGCGSSKPAAASGGQPAQQAKAGTPGQATRCHPTPWLLPHIAFQAVLLALGFRRLRRSAFPSSAKLPMQLCIAAGPCKRCSCPCCTTLGRLHHSSRAVLCSAALSCNSSLICRPATVQQPKAAADTARGGSQPSAAVTAPAAKVSTTPGASPAKATPSAIVSALGGGAKSAAQTPAAGSAKSSPAEVCLSYCCH